MKKTYYIIISILTIISTIRYLYISVYKHDYYYEKYLSINNKIVYGINAPRGRILDRNGKVLDQNGKSIKVYNSEKFQEIKIPEAIKENFNLGKKEVSADLYSKKIYEHKGQKNIYQSTDGNVEYWKNIDNSCFGIKAKNNYSLSKYEGIELTENQFIEHIKAYLDMYLDT